MSILRLCVMPHVSPSDYMCLHVMSHVFPCNVACLSMSCHMCLHIVSYVSPCHVACVSMSYMSIHVMSHENVIQHDMETHVT
jgi:hypothetical protein